MALWTDIITPADLTGYARESLAAYELRQGSLARWLPNREIPGLEARFIAGRAGLVEEARWRAYDAEPELGKRQPAKRTILEMPAIGQNIPITEYEQLLTRGADDDQMLSAILSTTESLVRGIVDSMERLRGVVINTGKATIAQDNFKTDDDFGRSPSHSVTLADLWDDPAADRLADLQGLVDIYVESNGVEPGAILASRRVIRALAAGDQFQTQLLNGGARPATAGDVDTIISGAGLPPIERYDRRTKSGRVLPDNRLWLLPAPVDPNDFDGTELGASFWGQTLTSMLPDFEIAAAEQPGIVVGTYRNEKPPAIAEVISDAIGMPVLANADLSLVATVL